MYKVLVVMDVLEEHKVFFDNISAKLDIAYKPAAELLPKDLTEVEAIVGNLPTDLLKYCEKLKLLQLNNAGTEGFTQEGVVPPGAVLANATGAYGVAMSEYMIGALLSLMKNFDQYRCNQNNHEWKGCGPVRAIYGSKTLVVGLGDIGSEFALRMHALGSRVEGIRKHISNKPDYVEKLHIMKNLRNLHCLEDAVGNDLEDAENFHKCLQKADVVASCLPGYQETFKVFDKAAFEAMKEGAYFINVGRGTAVDTEALCDALESKKLAGAVLDVTDPEPLPKEHRLWDAPNVLITPHVSGGYRVKEAHDRIVKIAGKNLIHLAKGEPFENIVDRKTGYRINY